MSDEFTTFSDEEYMKSIRRTMEETRCPEGLNVYDTVEKAIKGYWNRREQEVTANSKGFFRSVADWFKKYVK